MKFLTTPLQVAFVIGGALVSSSAIPALNNTSVDPMALGINCRGSAQCNLSPAIPDAALDEILGYANSLDPNRWYENGNHIICVNKGSTFDGVCVFLQDTQGEHGYQIKPLLQSLRDHGCKACGSVPVVFPSSNDPSSGILTVNYVVSTDCHGVC